MFSKTKNDTDALRTKPRTWPEFCDETTIHGLCYIGGTRAHSKCGRLLWALIFAGFFAVCTWQCTVSILDFLQQRVKTTTSVETLKEMQFPAITFCNENMFRKSVVAGSKTFLAGVASYITSDGSDYQAELKRVISTCYRPNHISSDNLTEALENGYKFWFDRGMTLGMRSTATDSYVSVVKCWWLHRPVDDCQQFFVNHATDYGWCFTFNPGEHLLSSYALGYQRLTTSAYGGLNVSAGYTAKTIKVAGQQHGLRILLNADAKNYCVAHQEGAVGFKILVHDPEVQPLFSVHPSISAGAGYEITVVVRITYVRRGETASMGRCADYVHLPFYPKAKTYYREACYLQCLTDYVHTHCNCTPLYEAPGAHTLLANKTGKYVAVCWGMDSLCMKAKEKQFFNESFKTRCPLCQPPCKETKYDLQISMLRFPAAHSAKKLAEAVGRPWLDIDRLRRDYVMMRFYVDSMRVNVVEESPEYELFKLVADVGGLLGLFLGMSVMSLGEIIHQLFNWCGSVRLGRK